MADRVDFYFRQRVTEAELDRVVGSLYSYVEQAFPSLVRLAFASKFAAG